MPVINLRHLPIVGSEKIEYSRVMSEIVGYTNTWYSKRFRFAKDFLLATKLIRDIAKIDVSTVEWTEECQIKKPVNIDFISFQAMMELQAVLEQGITDESLLADNISKIIAIACFSAEIEGDYKSDGEAFTQLQERILDQPLIQMFGLYNWIIDSVDESAKMWSQRFLSVEVSDPDYEQANGHRMNQFNVIVSVKSICKEFNIPFEKAWQMSYNLVQTNSYANATATKIQDDMRILKEAKMKQQRRQN